MEKHYVMIERKNAMLCEDFSLRIESDKVPFKGFIAHPEDICCCSGEKEGVVYCFDDNTLYYMSDKLYKLIMTENAKKRLVEHYAVNLGNIPSGKMLHQEQFIFDNAYVITSVEDGKKYIIYGGVLREL